MKNLLPTLFSKKQSATHICPCCGEKFDTQPVSLKEAGWKTDISLCGNCYWRIKDGVKMEDFTYGSFFVRLRTSKGEQIQIVTPSLNKTEGMIREAVENGGVVDFILFGVALESNLDMLSESKKLPIGWESERRVLTAGDET